MLFRSLRQFLEGGELPNLTQAATRHNNILLDVVTVFSHVVDFWRLATTKIENDLFSSVSVDSFSQLQDIQGFCIGFLTAAAVSVSKSKADFQRYIATALRLAVCVGALVELDAIILDSSQDQGLSMSISWSSQPEYDGFKNILNTYQSVGLVTVQSDKDVFTNIDRVISPV